MEMVMSQDIKKTQEKAPSMGLRETLAVFINSSPLIESITEVRDETEDLFDERKPGTIEFTVPMNSMGFTADVYSTCKHVIFSRYFINLIAEILVRENINMFISKLATVDGYKYEELVNGWNYKNFGMKRVGSKFVFTFYAAFIQDILAEDFKKEIRHEY